MDADEPDPRNRIYWKEGLKLLLWLVLWSVAAIVALAIFAELFETLTGWEIPD